MNKVLEFRHSFTEDESLGTVKTTKSIKIPANEVISVSGLTKIRKGGYSMHAIAEASNKDTLPKGISLAESQYVNLDHGSSRVGILLKNNTDQAITLPSKILILTIMFLKHMQLKPLLQLGMGVLRWMNLLLVLPLQLKMMMAHSY